MPHGLSHQILMHGHRTTSVQIFVVHSYESIVLKQVFNNNCEFTFPWVETSKLLCLETK